MSTLLTQMEIGSELYDYRNRRIGEFLKELNLTEGRGTGIPKILRPMKANGSPNPRFETDEDRTYFVSYFPAHSLVISKETRQVGTKSGPSYRTSYRTSLELLPGAAQILRNYGTDWS